MKLNFIVLIALLICSSSFSFLHGQNIMKENGLGTVGRSANLLKTTSPLTVKNDLVNMSKKTIRNQARRSDLIVGPTFGFTGSQYRLFYAAEDVTWRSSNENIATIDANGILAAKGRGLITLTANYLERAYSLEIMVGMPRYILSASHELGTYTVTAKCIDTECDDYLSNAIGALTYNWGIKCPGKEIRWVMTNVPNVLVPIQKQKAVVFLEVTDDFGHKTQLQNIVLNSQDIYVAENQNLYINSKGELFKANKRKYSYSYARLFMHYRAGISDKYKEREWMATSAMVLKPFSVSSIIDVRNGGPLIKDILTNSDLDYIKNNSVDNQVYRCVMVLLNFKSKRIQFLPVTFTYKNDL